MSGLWHFEFYYSLLFWAVLLLVVALIRLLGAAPRARSCLLLVSSSGLLLAIPRFNIHELLIVWGISAASYTIGATLCHPSRVVDPQRRRWLALLGILLSLGFLAFFKYRIIQETLWGRPGRAPSPADLLSLLGVSYFTFRMLHVTVETYRRSIPTLDLLGYFNYILFFPAFISGPINRYPQFVAQLESGGAGTLPRDLKLSGERIIHGLFKKLVLVHLIYPYLLTQQSRPLDQLSLGEVLVGLYAYALYFYFDFSAYSDLAIGAARLVGIELPENFDHPFLQRNIRELWSHWHMSLTGWLVDYVYWPTVRRLRELEYMRARPVALSIAGMTLTFLVCGLWHGEGANFVLWGLYHGVGISVLTLYQRQKRKVSNPLLRSYFRSRASAVLGTFATFNFFTLGLTLFVLDLDRLGTLISGLLR